MPPDRTHATQRRHATVEAYCGCGVLAPLYPVPGHAHPMCAVCASQHEDADVDHDAPPYERDSVVIGRTDAPVPSGARRIHLHDIGHDMTAMRRRLSIPAPVYVDMPTGGAE